MSGAKRTAFIRAPECTSRVACDGNVLALPARAAKGICGACEKTLAKRGKLIAPRGANYREKHELRRRGGAGNA